MGLGCSDVLTIKVPVEINGSVNLLHDCTGARRKSSTPHFVAHGIPTKALMTGSQSSFAKKRLTMVLAGGIAGIVIGLAGVYGIATLTRNVGGDAACRPAIALANKLAPFATGEVAAVNVAKSPLKVPNLAFQDTA